jgi:hypothetical protein
MRQERFEDERVQRPRRLFHGTRFPGLFLNPGGGDLVVLVEAEETGFTSTLDQLIGFGDEFVWTRGVGVVGQ